MTSSDPITAFVRARLTEMEDAATAATSTASHLSPNWYPDTEDDGSVVVLDEHDARVAVDVGGWGWHIALNDPATAHRNAEFFRLVLDAHRKAARGTCSCETDSDIVIFPCVTLRALAAVWRHHLDYDEEWKP